MIDKTNLAVVTSPKVFLDNNYEKIDEDGLLSERIFGPRRSYKCICGQLSTKTQHAEQRCPRCGVLCTSSDVRYKTFAKIILPFPIYKPTYKNKIRLSRIVLKEQKYILDPNQSELCLREINYLKYDPNEDRCKIVKKYEPATCIPLQITGTYTLYLAILICWQSFGSVFAKETIESCFDYELLVTPPSTRFFMVQPKNGGLTLKKHEMNDNYIEILEMCSYDWTHIVTDPQKIRQFYISLIEKSIGTSTPISDDELKFYDSSVCKYQHYVNEIYRLVIDSLSGKEGFIRKDFLGRSIDFSSRAHVIIDPSLKAYEIKLPKNNFIRLWFIEYMRFLQQHKQVRVEELLAVVKLTETKITSKFPQYVDEFIEYIFSENVDYHNIIVLINRQPTLYKYGIPAVLVVGVNDNDVTSVSPLMIESLNMDFDGDTGATYRVHDINAQHELEERAFILNNIHYDQNGDYVQTIRIEAVYAAYTLLNSKPETEIKYKINKLTDLKEDFNDLFNVDDTIEFNNKIYSYGVCLFNKWCGYNNIIVPKFTSNNNISKFIFQNSKSNIEYHDRLSILCRKLFWYSSLNFKNPLTFSLHEIATLKSNQHKPLLSKLPRNPYIGYHIYKGLIQQVYGDIPDNHFFKKLIGAKLGKVGTQLARMIGAIGYIANAQNIIDSNPLVDNVLNGLDEDAFFRTATGARKGLVDKSQATPASGYLERSMVVNLSPVEIGSADCGTNLGLLINIFSKKHAKSLVNRYYKINNDDNWTLFKEEDIDKYVGQSILFRSPITCNEPGFKICRKCFGKYDIKSPYVGVLAGQYLSERQTQLSMRTFIEAPEIY